MAKNLENVSIPRHAPNAVIFWLMADCSNKYPTYETEQIKQAHDIRKNCERPFNLLKNQTGLETIRVRSQYATMARCALSSIAVLLIKMAGTRRKKTAVRPKQIQLFADAA